MDTALINLPLATLQTWLSEALSARHTIVIGKKETYISHGQNARSYKVDQLAELDQYIANLQGAITAKAAGKTAGRRPIHIGVGFPS
jgi:hypothetical protein